MADQKLSALTELAATPAVDDEVYIRDISEAAADESKRITIANILGSCLLADGSRALAGALDMGSQALTNVNIDSGTIGGVTLDGTITIGGQAFDAGAVSVIINTTGTLQGLELISTQDAANGCHIYFKHISASPAATDIVGRLIAEGRDSNADITGYCVFDMLIENVTHTTECGKMQWLNLLNGSWNVAMTLSSGGTVGGDLAYAEFDEEDDALILRDGYSGKQLQILEKLGVVERKNTGSGWMLNFQPMMHLLAGGIYQNRARIDGSFEQLNKRLEKLELALPIGRS